MKWIRKRRSFYAVVYPMSLAFVWAVIWGMGLLLGFERSLRLITFALGALVLAVLLGIGYLSARRESKVR